jgi:hypothetical protein
VSLLNNQYNLDRKINLNLSAIIHKFDKFVGEHEGKLNLQPLIALICFNHIEGNNNHKQEKNDITNNNNNNNNNIIINKLSIRRRK